MFEYKFEKKNKKIAAFSLFNTLIKTKSKETLPISIDDYNFVFDNVLDKLNYLLKKKYKIIIFISFIRNKNNSKALTYIKEIINNIFPFAYYFISTQNDIYKIPMCGLYIKFLKFNNSPSEIFYVGNNAGRENDTNSDDINFAYNCNIRFLTDTQFFLDRKENVNVKLPAVCTSKVNSISDIELFTKNTTIIVMQGYPSSGKSTFINDYINYYKLTNKYIVLPNHRDEPRMFAKKYKDALDQNKMIFIDYTNSSKEIRRKYFEILPSYYDAIGIRITTNKDLSYNLNKQRYYNSHTDPKYVSVLTDQKRRPNLSTKIYNRFDEIFEPMTKIEGFTKIYNYTPNVKLKYIFNKLS